MLQQIITQAKLVIRRDNTFLLWDVKDIKAGDEVFAYNYNLKGVDLSWVRYHVATSTWEQLIDNEQDTAYNAVTSYDEEWERIIAFYAMYILTLQKWVTQFKHWFGNTPVSWGNVINLYIGEKPNAMCRSIQANADYCVYDISCDCDCTILSLFCPAWVPKDLQAITHPELFMNRDDTDD